MSDSKTSYFSFLNVLAVLFFIGLLLWNSACGGQRKEVNEEMAHIYKAPDIKERLAQYEPSEITFDRSILNEEQRLVLEKLVKAAKIVDSIFWKQASHVGLAIKQKLEQWQDPAAADYLRYLEINFGPFDRLDENRPFIGTVPKPPGAGFYPPDMTKGYFQGYTDGLKQRRPELESPYTLIKRQDERLVAVPYNEEYREGLEAIALYLREAAEITTNASLKKYLNQRAVDLLSNDYYKSDCDWIDLEGNLVEIVIGPYEVYEDGLMGLKTSYEAFVYINDTEEMAKIKGYLDFLSEMQQALPVEKKYRAAQIEGLKSPLNVAFEIFTAGETKAGVQTLAFVLPNDPRVREEKGTKKVFLKNMMEAKFEKVLVPIAHRILAEEDAADVTFWAYFNEVILHEISHALGVIYVTLPDGTKITKNKALKEHYPAVEESKADAVGIHNVEFLMNKGLIPTDKEREIYTTYLAGMFRSIRFGVYEAHSLGILLQFNFLREKGAFVYDAETDRFHVDMGRIKEAVKELAQKLLILEGDGNYDNVVQFIEQYGKPDEITERTVAKLIDIPIDIAPIFKLFD